MNCAGRGTPAEVITNFQADMAAAEASIADGAVGVESVPQVLSTLARCHLWGAVGYLV